jgi:cytochrome c peroxidase
MTFENPALPRKNIAFLAVLAALLCGCGSGKKAADLDASMGPAGVAEVADTTPAALVKPKGDPVNLEVPLGLPPLPAVAGTPMTDQLVRFGRRLFYEGNIGADGITSCGSCHSYDHAFAETRQVPLGFSATRGERNTPSLLNVAYSTSLDWDGGVQTAETPLGLLEAQVKFPLEDPSQMATKTDSLEKALNISDQYHLAMQRTYGKMVVVRYVLAARAIAAFERTLLCGNSPFDRYLFGHDANAISPAAIRGWNIFKDPKKGNCIACHTVGEKDALFTDGKYHNLGVGLDSTGEGHDLGRFRVTAKDADRGAFRTPSLRNVAETPPYMHNGSLRSLRGVVDFYSEGGSINPYIDPLIKKINLNEKDRDDLVSFLNTLTGDMPLNTGRLTPQEEAAEAAADESKSDKIVVPNQPEEPAVKPSPFDKKQP